MNEDFNFEYGDDTIAHYGCGTTLHNVFWYFGGWDRQRRQVKLLKYLFNINLLISGQQNCRVQAAASRRFKF